MAGEQTSQQTGNIQQGGETSKTVAALLSMVIPGSGHYIAGLNQRAFYWFFGTAALYLVIITTMVFLIGFLLMWLIPLAHIAAGVDAYIQVSEA